MPSNDTRELVKRFVEQGGKVRITKDGHLKLYDKKGRMISKAANAGHSVQGKSGYYVIRSAMRRAGFDV